MNLHIRQIIQLDGCWDPPIPRPELTEQQEADRMCYTWDESAYQADNTAGWVYGKHPAYVE